MVESPRLVARELRADLRIFPYRGPMVRPELVPVGVVAVVMGVEDESDRFVGGGLNDRKIFLRFRRAAGIEHEDVIPKYHPRDVAPDAIARRDESEDSWSDLDWCRRP